jgi:chitinase
MLIPPIAQTFPRCVKALCGTDFALTSSTNKSRKKVANPLFFVCFASLLLRCYTFATVCYYNVLYDATIVFAPVYDSIPTRATLLYTLTVLTQQKAFVFLHELLLPRRVRAGASGMNLVDISEQVILRLRRLCRPNTPATWNKILFIVGYLAAVMDAFSPSEQHGGSRSINSNHPHLDANKPLLPPPIRPLPKKLLVGYATNCDEHVVQAVRDGMNVIIWSFMEIHCLVVDDEVEADDDGPPPIGGRIEWNSLDLDCIRETIDQLDKEGYNDTVHLVSFGGWNGPHLDSKLDPKEWFDLWKESAGDVFHGIDWDLEGHDDLESPTNVFTMECLDKMGYISRLAKQEGYIIGMAPPQSYLDISNSRFSRSVNLAEPGRSWHGEFHYFGANVYAYLLAKYKEYIDFISIQFYESYSRAGMCIYGQEKMAPETYLVSYVKNLVNQDCSLLVNFEDDPSTKLSNQRVPLPLSKLVFGFANGWALDTGDRALYVEPNAIHKAYASLSEDGQEPRGFMFWVVGEEGKNEIFYGPALNEILQTRGATTTRNAEEEL